MISPEHSKILWPKDRTLIKVQLQACRFNSINNTKCSSTSLRVQLWSASFLSTKRWARALRNAHTSEVTLGKIMIVIMELLRLVSCILRCSTFLHKWWTIRSRKVQARVWSRCKLPRWETLIKRSSVQLQKRSLANQNSWKTWAVRRRSKLVNTKVLKWNQVVSLKRSSYSPSKRKANRKSLHQTSRT